MAFIKVGSLWIKESEKTGKKYLSGVIELDKLEGVFVGESRGYSQGSYP